jgi:hypothetical protein
MALPPELSSQGSDCHGMGNCWVDDVGEVYAKVFRAPPTWRLRT